jgi:hypothetical protein
MLIDSPKITEGSSIANATVASGEIFPNDGSVGELFFLTTGKTGLYTYATNGWNLLADAADLVNHVENQDIHLNFTRRNLLDSITVDGNTINNIPSIKTSLDNLAGNLNSHISDNTKHVTSDQKTFLNNLNFPSLTANNVNQLVNVKSNVQSQLDDIVNVNAKQTTDIANLTSNTSNTTDSLRTDLNNHINDQDRHLTSSQRNLINGITVGVVDINKVSGLNTYLGSSTLPDRLNQINSGKLLTDGSNSMLADLNVGGNKIRNVGTPVLLTDAVNKEYVDNFVQGLHWVGSVKVATTENIALSGLQTIDTVFLSEGDRVLVKNQTNQGENGIWVASSSGWARAQDFNTPIEINNSAVLVLSGNRNNKTTWVQSGTVTDLGSSAITFSEFSKPSINGAGAGIIISENGTISASLYSGGGLFLTTDNNTGSTDPLAKIALTNVGTAGDYFKVTTDNKGRVTAGSNPTTLSGFGITDAVKNNRAVTAGNGLTGGGDLTNDRTISLGIPSTLSGNTTNSTTGVTHTHALSITKADVNLGNVDNTSDANKPVSAAQSAADNLRVLKSGDTMSDTLFITKTNNANSAIIITNTSPSITLNRTVNSGSNVIYGALNGTVSWAMMLSQSDIDDVAGFYRYNPTNGVFIDRTFWCNNAGDSNVQSNLYIGKNTQAKGFYTIPGGVNTGYALNVQSYANGGTDDKYGQLIIADTAIGTNARFYCRHLSGQFAYFQWDINGAIFTMNSSGQGTSSGGWVSTSDNRVKYDNVKISNALEKLEKLTGYTGKRSDQTTTNSMTEHPTKAHLFAQDVYDILPEAVIVPQNYNRETNTGDLLALDHNGVIALLVEAVKELSGQVKELKSEVASLKAQ